LKHGQVERQKADYGHELKIGTLDKYRGRKGLFRR